MTLLILVIALLIQVEQADYYTYSYSFQPNYDSSVGEEFKCHSYESLKSISCGEFADGEAFLRYYLTIKGEDNARDGERTVSQFVADLRTKGYSDDDLAVSLIGKKGFTYRRDKHWDMSKLVVGVATAFGIAVGCLAALLALYKVVLFVVHGHTRIVRE